MQKTIKQLLMMTVLLLCVSCAQQKKIVSSLDEREANVIVVFLESKGIKTSKALAAGGGPIGGGESAAPKFDILVDEAQSIEAMAILNSNGLPQRRGTNLLALFAKQGLMSSDKEETIRYQSGLAQQITNMILMIDGVIDASVQLSFPAQENLATENGPPQKMTAAVFVKHQGIIDDPNSHLENKIKRLISGSINDLDINDVTVISDRSRFTDVTLNEIGDQMSPRGKEYVKIWSIVMSKESAARFRSLFVLVLSCAILFAAAIGWLLWKIYPLLKSGAGIKELLNPLPLGKKPVKEAYDQYAGE